jgi:LuxR family maltose regulon positive regulatory protein
VLEVTVNQPGSMAALTAAEMRVLQFLPSHLTFPQIGEHLFLSANTVKTHALSIYRKLGATSRNEAVTRAQTVGLVEAPMRV